MSARWLKPLRHPRVWLGVWLAAVLTVVVVCLIPPPALALPPGGDKLEHLLAYFLLAGSAVQLFRSGRALAGIGAALVLMGIGIEFAQGALTATRMADPADAVANTIGVLAGLATALTPGRDMLLRLRG